MYSALTCHTLDALTLQLQSTGHYYLDRATRKFFRSRVSAIWPTRDGAVITETVGASFNPAAGRAAKCTQFVFSFDASGQLNCDVRTLYNGLGSGDSLPVQKRAALACAKFVRYR